MRMFTFATVILALALSPNVFIASPSVAQEGVNGLVQFSTGIDWTGSEEVPEGVTRHKDILYRAVNDRKDTEVGKASPNPDADSAGLLDIYVPNDKPDAPVVFFIHGGAWTSGDKASGFAVACGGKRKVRRAGENIFEDAEGLCQSGYVVVSVNYTLVDANDDTTRFPKFVEDTATAFKWVYDNISEESYGGDPDRIFVMGYSAGGHIGALLSTESSYLSTHGLTHSDAVKGFIGLAGIYSIPSGNDIRQQLADEFVFDDVFTADKDKREDASPQFKVSKGDPSTLLLRGEDDAIMTKEEAEAYKQKLDDPTISVSCTHTEVKGRAHLTILDQFGVKDDEAKTAVIEFLAERIKVLDE